MLKNIFDFEKNEKIENKYFKKDTKKYFSKSKERIAQYPQVINNYDVNVRVNIKKLNDNKINIENMNISELINRKFDKNEKRDYFNKTDNNINYLNYNTKSKDNKYNLIDNNLSNIDKYLNENGQNDQHYNNMISNLKNEFKEITKNKEINIDNIYKIDRKKENIRMCLFNEEKNNISSNNNNNNFNKINKKKEITINDIKKKILNIKPDNINNKKYSWNLKSLNNRNKNIKKDEINAGNIDKTYNNIKYDENNNNNINGKNDIKENKMKTQNNFYKIPSKYINEEKTNVNEDIKNNNLKKGITFMNNNNNNKKELINLNLTDNNLIINNLNDDSSSINSINENKEKNNLCLNFTLNGVKNNIIREYISASQKQNNIPNKNTINKSNSYICNKIISPNNKTQSFIIEEKSKEKNKIINTRNKDSPLKIQNNTTNNINNKSKILYLDKRINRIKKKMINQIRKENILNNYSKENIIYNTNNEIKNIKIEKNISFSFIKNINLNINKQNELTGKTLLIINKILNAQNNIIFELKQQEFILKNELNKKNKEIIELKNFCLKLMWFIKKDNLYFENNKKKNIIQSQIIKENQILRKLYINGKVNNIQIIQNNIDNNKIKVTNGINEDGIFNKLINKLKEKNNYNYEYKKNQERLVTLENNGRFRRERVYFNDKKRNKSYERINDKKEEYSKNISYNKNNNKIILNTNDDEHFNCSDYIIKKKINLFDNNNNDSIKIGKKIKYITKDKNS